MNPAQCVDKESRVKTAAWENFNHDIGFQGWPATNWKPIWPYGKPTIKSFEVHSWKVPVPTFMAHMTKCSILACRPVSIVTGSESLLFWLLKGAKLTLHLWSSHSGTLWFVAVPWHIILAHVCVFHTIHYTRIVMTTVDQVQKNYTALTVSCWGFHLIFCPSKNVQIKIKQKKTFPLADFFLLPIWVIILHWNKWGKT